jgi:hypothetical protein
MAGQTSAPPSYVLVRVTRLLRPRSASPPFWPADLGELVIEVYATIPASELQIYGVDPSTAPPAPGTIVFSVELADAQLSALLECIDGTRAFSTTPQPPAPDGKPRTRVDIAPDSNVVVIGGDGPGGTGPNMGIVAASAVAIASNVALANVALRLDARKPR